MDLEGLELLSEPQCRALLRHEHLGRVAVSIGGLPAVFPVNYVVASDEILFFTAEGTKLRAATANTIVTFEVDHVDPVGERGWSVLVIGQARERTEPAVVAGAKASGLRPWAQGDRSHLIGLAIELVSGRRIGPEGDAGRRSGAPVGSLAGPLPPISSLANRPVRVEPRCSLRELAEVMREADVSSVLVGPNDAIVTERDLTRALRAGSGPDASAATVAVTDVISVDQDATVVEAAAEMLRHEIRHLLVHNHRGRVVGLVSMRDLIGALLDAVDPVVWTKLRESLSANPEGDGRPHSRRSQPPGLG